MTKPMFCIKCERELEEDEKAFNIHSICNFCLNRNNEEFEEI